MLTLISIIRKIKNSEKKNKARILIICIILGIAIILSSIYCLTVDEAKINIRDSIAVFAAIIGGPIAGIVVGIIGAIFRYSQGGWTALPCALATLFAGIITSVIVLYFKKVHHALTLNKQNIIYFTLFVGLWEIIHLLVLVPLLGQKSFNEGFSIMYSKFLVPMVIFNMIALATYLLITSGVIKNKMKVEVLEDQAEQIESTETEKK